MIAEELHGVAALDHTEAFGDESLEFDGADLGAILFLLAALLAILVAVEFALDAIDRSMEEIYGGPEEIFKVGFEPRVAKSPSGKS